MERATAAATSLDQSLRSQWTYNPAGSQHCALCLAPSAQRWLRTRLFNECWQADWPSGGTERM